MTRRLVVAFLVLTAIVLVALEIPLGLNVSRQEEDELLADIQRDAFFLASFVEDSLERGDGPDLEVVADEYQDRTGARVVIVDAEASLLADSDPLPGTDLGRSFDREEIVTALEGGVATGRRSSETLGTDLVYAAVPVASGGVVHGAVRVSYPREELDERIRRYWAALAGIAVVSLLAAAGLGYAIGRWASRPLVELTGTAAELGRGDLAARAKEGSGPPEVRTLAAAFNDTAGRLEELVGSQEAFVADASHQLRTPLTALRLRIENAIEESPDAAVPDLDAALAETDRLARLVDGLLTLARADRASGRASSSDLAIGDLLAERADVWAPVGAELGIVVEARPTDLVVRANLDRATQVLDNLVANALDAVATVGGGRVELRAERDGSTEATVHVVDDGPGLPDAELEHAFDRFWRAEGDRTDGRLGGTGLGLAICRKLVVIDGGRIELASAGGAPGRPGIDARVTYPLGAAATGDP